MKTENATSSTPVQRLVSVFGDYPPHGEGDWDVQCARCGSSCEWVRCDNCEDGYDDHDCGEDCCCCAYPEPNVVCDICRGRCGWYRCLSSKEWCEANPLPGREQTPRHTFEWFPDHAR